MKDVNEYKLVGEYFSENLEARVNDLLAEGWIPLGLPFTKRVDEFSTKIYQAMIKTGT